MFDQVRRRSWRAVLSGPIEDPGDAAYLAGGLGWALVVVGVIGCIAEIVRISGGTLPRSGTAPSTAAWVATLVILAAPIVLGLLIWKLRSRVAACLALGLVVANLVGFAVLLARGRVGGNVLLMIVFLWVALRAVQATFAYHRLAARGEPAAQASAV